MFQKLDQKNNGFVTFEDFKTSHEALADLLRPATSFNAEYVSDSDAALAKIREIEDDAIVETAVDTLCSLVEVNEDDTSVRLDTVRHALATRSRPPLSNTNV